MTEHTDKTKHRTSLTATVCVLLALCLTVAGCSSSIDAAAFGVLQAEAKQLAEQNTQLTERIETLESAQADIADSLSDTTDTLADAVAKADAQQAENERLELCAATYADLAWSDATALAANNGLWRFHMWADTEYFEDLLADISNPWTADNLLDRGDLADSSYAHAYAIAEEHNCEHIDSEHYFWSDPAS